MKYQSVSLSHFEATEKFAFIEDVAEKCGSKENFIDLETNARI